MDKLMEKIKALSLPEQTIAGGGILMLIASIFNWWSYSQSGEIAGTRFSASVSGSGWDAPGSIWSILAILVSLALAGVVISTKLANVQMPALPQNVTWGQVWGGGAAVVVVLMLLKAWRILALPAGGFSFGFILAAIATVAIAYGGYMLYTAEKGSSAS